LGRGFGFSAAGKVLDEFEEWREDVRERGIGSRVVLLVASAGWGALGGPGPDSSCGR